MVMKEIKFRAWSIGAQRMLEWEDIKSNPRTLRGIFEWPDMYTPLQYTGVKDQQGREIYKGDKIVCRKTGQPRRKGYVGFRQGDFYLIENHGYFKSLSWLIDQKYTIEVVGDIYEDDEAIVNE